MNKIYLKLIFVCDKKVMEVVFDKRLSFEDNLRLLQSLIPNVNVDNFYIFDKQINIFLDKKEPINSFNMNNLTTLYVF